MTRVLVEVMDLRDVDKKLMRQLRRASFGDGGWMVPMMEQILLGYAVQGEWVYDGEDGRVVTKRVPLNYCRAHALIARDEDGKFLGWAMVRHPLKEVRAQVADWEKRSHKYEYGGRRPDFMVYINKRGRRKRVARSLLLIAFNNWGRVDTYPHDDASDRFYEKNAQFVQAHDTGDFTNAKFKTREVF